MPGVRLIPPGNRPAEPQTSLLVASNDLDLALVCMSEPLALAAMLEPREGLPPLAHGHRRAELGVEIRAEEEVRLGPRDEPRAERPGKAVRWRRSISSSRAPTLASASTTELPPRKARAHRLQAPGALDEPAVLELARRLFALLSGRILGLATAELRAHLDDVAALGAGGGSEAQPLALAGSRAPPGHRGRSWFSGQPRAWALGVTAVGKLADSVKLGATVSPSLRSSQIGQASWLGRCPAAV
jgi:hypothetical protein